MINLCYFWEGNESSFWVQCIRQIILCEKQGVGCADYFFVGAINFACA